MATIRRSGKGWQALIRKKQYLSPNGVNHERYANQCEWSERT
ncbi:hypothetical protein [Prochlorococcus marinus]|nr:hypothetical protein [Prochlorococcus marinus]